MPTLVILRGNTPDREIELGAHTLRIGRGDQNDVVLPDPAKSVSRFHAELRAEQGTFIVVDLNSQNGVWVAGRRVPQATLEPGVPVLLGTYQLVLKPERLAAPSATDATVMVSQEAAAPPSAATMVAPMPRPDPPPPPAPPPLPPPTPPPTPPPIRAAAKVAPKPAPPPAAHAKPATPARSTTPAKPGGSGILKWLLIGGSAVLILGVVVAGVLLMPVGSPRPERTGSTPADAPAPEPAAALPAAAAPVEPPPARPVEPPAPVAVPARVTPPPAETRAEPPRVAKPVATPPRQQPVGRRGTPVSPAETTTKGPNLALAFEEARAAMNRGDHPAAIAGLESILSVDPAYPKAADLLEVARSSARNAARSAVGTGAKAEADRDYPEAERQYQRALQADPQFVAAQDALRRLKARMLTEGEDAFKRARQYDALGRAQEAIRMYEKAIQLLPSDHANVKIAHERLAALKGGV